MIYADLNWGNYKPPSPEEQAWIGAFGHYPSFDPHAGALSSRLTLDVANLKQATRIIVVYHYLHRGRTMAQLPYWVCIDGIKVGVILYSLPRLSVPIQSVQPMNLLELARLWISPDVQGHTVKSRRGQLHTLSVASCAVAASLKRAPQDWAAKYPHLPSIQAIVSWADDVHHEGTIYKACNFQQLGKSGGSLHGNRRRANGGRDQLHADYTHTKTMYMLPAKRPARARRAQTACPPCKPAYVAKALVPTTSAGLFRCGQPAQPPV